MSLKLSRVSHTTFYNILVIFMNLLSLQKLNELFLLFIKLLNLVEQGFLLFRVRSAELGALALTRLRLIKLKWYGCVDLIGD